MSLFAEVIYLHHFKYKFIIDSDWIVRCVSYTRSKFSFNSQMCRNKMMKDVSPGSK